LQIAKADTISIFGAMNTADPEILTQIPQMYGVFNLINGILSRCVHPIAIYAETIFML
jgi:hypothetical protein